MSEILSSPFKKPACGDMHNIGGLSVSAQLRDSIGGLINLQVMGTDPEVVGTVDVSATGDYTPTAGNVNPDGTFFIIPETDNGVYVVVLADGSQFTVTAVQSHAYLGQVLPYRILSVLQSGTTGVFSVVY